MCLYIYCAAWMVEILFLLMLKMQNENCCLLKTLLIACMKEVKDCNELFVFKMAHFSNNRIHAEDSKWRNWILFGIFVLRFSGIQNVNLEDIIPNIYNTVEPLSMVPERTAKNKLWIHENKSWESISYHKHKQKDENYALFYLGLKK